MTQSFSIAETLQSLGFSRREGDWSEGEVYLSKSNANGLAVKAWDHHNLESVLFAAGAMPWVCLTWTNPNVADAPECVIGTWKTADLDELSRLLPALSAIVDRMSWRAPDADAGLPGLLILAEDADFLIQVSTHAKGKPLATPGFIARWRGNKDPKTGSAVGHSYDLAEMWRVLMETRDRHLAPITPEMAF
jgi:hypothetical protein